MTSPRPSPPRADPAAACSNGQVAGRYSHVGYTVVWAQGEIDIATGPDLMQELTGAVGADQCRVVVDLTRVTFMDAIGLNALALAKRRAEAGHGEVRLVGASGMVRTVLHITGLDQIFPVHSTIEESIRPRPAAQHNGTAVQHDGTGQVRGLRASPASPSGTSGVLGPLG